MAHDALRRVLRRGDTAVDATAGNGYDTLFVASCVGPEGRVWSFDVQEAALAATRKRLDAASDVAPVTLVHDGHENMGNHLGEGTLLRAVIFNLGYLPGSDKSIITRKDTTLEAIQQSMIRMAPGGVISIHVYTGHDGGSMEREALSKLSALLPYSKWQCMHTFIENKKLRCEHLFLFQKRL